MEGLVAEAEGDLPFIAVTHHAPHPACLPEQQRGTWMAGNSASNLSALIGTGRIDLWVHGHVHANVDMTMKGGTRIVCNPAGSMFSNLAFDESLIVEIGA